MCLCRHNDWFVLVAWVAGALNTCAQMPAVSSAWAGPAVPVTATPDPHMGPEQRFSLKSIQIIVTQPGPTKIYLRIIH